MVSDVVSMDKVNWCEGRGCLIRGVAFGRNFFFALWVKGWEKTKQLPPERPWTGGHPELALILHWDNMECGLPGVKCTSSFEDTEHYVYISTGFIDDDACDWSEQGTTELARTFCGKLLSEWNDGNG